MTSLSSCARTLKSVGSSRVLIARRHWVARVRPVLHDAADKLGRQAMKRRPAALRATAPAPSLRLRREQQGELVDVSATVWESGSGMEEREEDTVATSIGSMAIVRSDSRIKRRFQGRRTSRHKYDTKERIIQPVRVDDRRGGGGKQKERGATAACSSRSDPGRA